MLSWPIYICLAAAAGIAALPARNSALPRRVAFGVTLLNLIISGLAVSSFPNDGQIHTICDLQWIPALGIHYHLAADGISATLVVLTAIASLCAVLFSWNIEHRAKEFFILFFLLISGVYGVFLSFDLFLFFVFYELAIIPKYFLIAVWGSTNKEYGAMKLALYSFAGSAMVLLVIVGLYANTTTPTFDLQTLLSAGSPYKFQVIAFPISFVGFAILAGLWPFHTWAPTGHVAAPTAASMLLAGVVMKLGAYGILRVSLPLFPEAHAYWQPFFAGLAVIGIVYGALVALSQKDFKFVIGYSSVSHMGFVLLGLVTLNLAGISGAVVQMFSHGIIAGLLFAVVGRMVYDRTHTRDLDQLEDWNLNWVIPFASITFVLASLASMGFPGFSGFVAELSILMGAWKAFPVLAVITGIGILVGIAFAMRALQKAFFSQTEIPVSHAPIAAITWPEKLAAIVLLSTTLAVGLYPRIVFDLIMPALGSPYFGFLKAATPL